MLEQRSVKLDILALLLAGLCVFLALTLGTYDAADPPSTSVYPPAVRPHKRLWQDRSVCCSRSAQRRRRRVRNLTASLGILAGGVVARKTNRASPASCVRLDLVARRYRFAGANWLPHLSPGPAIGAGGYIGALGRAWLESHFALSGSVILLLSVIGGGLLLCTDYVLLTISAMIFGAREASRSRSVDECRKPGYSPTKSPGYRYRAFAGDGAERRSKSTAK